MKRALEIDREDEEWAGEIDLSIFQQVKDQQEKARIIAKLEAQNRVTKRQDGAAETEMERCRGPRGGVVVVKEQLTKGV